MVKISIFLWNFQITVHTCGVCEMIIDKNNIPTHVCMKGYIRFFIDENFYFYPVTGIIFVYT